MNKRVLLIFFATLAFVSLRQTCCSQILYYSTDPPVGEHVLNLFPLRSSDIEFYDGCTTLVGFPKYDIDNCYSRMALQFSPFNHQQLKTPVQSIKLTCYSEIEYFGEKKWDKRGEEIYYFKNGRFVSRNGLPIVSYPYMGYPFIELSDEFLLVLDARNKETKESRRYTATYMRSNNRVDQVTIRDKRDMTIKWIFQYKYLSNSSDIISKIHQYNSNGVMMAEVVYRYDNNHLITATYNEKDGKDKTTKSITYYYDVHNMIVKRTTIDYLYDRNSSSNTFRSLWDGGNLVENNSNNAGSLVFSNFNNGNWTEVIIYKQGKYQINGDKERWVRTIIYH